MYGAVGASASVAVEFKIIVDTTANAITNTASVSGNEPDLNATNDSDSAIIEDAIKEADLSVLKIDSEDPVPVAGNFSYKLTVTNEGPQDLNDQDKTEVATTPPTLVDTLQAEERKAILFAVSGSMKDEDIAERAGMVAGHFDLYAYGKPLLADTGDYFLGWGYRAALHNTIEVDGRDQARGASAEAWKRIVSRPFSTR